ncbi:MAG: tripartite tricarboxylate transporter TctB family protein [Alphaproteobacteria bacterium]|nr:tripartite tricarboxylate transporter TctB family protein [Alphaproteobacteria bacterium]
MGRLKINQDLAAGAMFIAVGVVGLYLGRAYPMGTSLRMGPGYLPNVLCWILIVLGTIVGGKGAVLGGLPLERWYFRPLVLVCAGLMVFALLIEGVGLPAAVIATVVVGAMGGQEFRLIEALILGVALALAAIAIFIYGLGLPMPMLPR